VSAERKVVVISGVSQCIRAAGAQLGTIEAGKALKVAARAVGSRGFGAQRATRSAPSAPSLRVAEFAAELGRF